MLDHTHPSIIIDPMSLLDAKIAINKNKIKKKKEKKRKEKKVVVVVGAAAAYP